MVQPVIEQLVEAGAVTQIVTQDDPTFPALAVPDAQRAALVHHDHTLERSFRADIETVPTLIDDRGARVLGWHREQWETISGVDALGLGLPDQRPGCGSMSVDPDVVDDLAARFGNAATSSRRIEFASLEDEFEAMFDRGWSDGLPLVPPTPERVERMLSATTRQRGDIVAVVPPNLVEATVEKVAINAVMAGCRPEYLPVVLTAVEAICTDEFNMHGVLATTMPVGPILVVNGPIRHELAMNAGMNVLGPGNRANATIGRAVQLCVRNLGGGRPGEIDRAAHGNPGKLGLCFAEDEEGSPWTSLAQTRGVLPGVDAVTVFCGEGPRIIFDQQSRSPESLAKSMAQTMLSTIHPRITGMDTMLVVCPEHMARFAEAGWDKSRFEAELRSHLDIEVNMILRDEDGIGEGIPRGLGLEGISVPKFPDDGLLIVHAGGPAGLFSSVIGGWLSGPMGSVAVTKEIMK